MSSPATRRYRTAAGTPRRRPRVRRASTRLTPMRAGAILAMLISAGAIYGLASTSVMGFGRLEITGNVVTPADTIRDQVDLPPGTNLVGLTTGPIIERLVGIPSVGSASVSVGLPDVLRVDGDRKAALIVVSNDAVFTYTGSTSLQFCPEASFELGLDFAAMASPNAPRIARGFYRASRGRGLAGLKGAITGHDVDRIEVVCERPCPLQVDGEDLGDVEEVTFECERAAVSVLV